MDESFIDDLNDWNPMEESFYDDQFNSYDVGAGSRLPRHQQPANMKRTECQQTKLFVFGLSERYTRDALTNIFSKYGKVVEVYIHDSYKWSFVKMKTFAAAETAIREVNNDQQLNLKVKYAREKPDSHSVGDGEPGSAEMNHRKSRDGNQFTDNYKQKSINDSGSSLNRSETQSSERSYPKSSHKSAHMNGDIAYQVVPNCCCCKCQTLDTCTNCLQPFCSVDCMIRGYKGHTSQCLQLPLHSSQQKISTKTPSSKSDHSFSSNSGNNLNYNNQSRKSNCLNDLDTKYRENNSSDVYNDRSASTSNSRAFETHRNNDKPVYNTSYDTCKDLDETCIKFNITEDRKRNHQKEHDKTFNSSNRDSKSSTQGSRYYSKMERDSQSQENRSSKENASWSARSQGSKMNDLSRDNRTRESGNGVNNDSWETRSSVSGYHSKKETDSSRDNRTRESGNGVNNDSWETRTSVSGYHSKKEIDSSRDNRTRESGNGVNKDQWETRSFASGYHSKKETDSSSRDNRTRESGNGVNNDPWETRSSVSGYHHKKDITSPRDNYRSRVSGNNPSKENESAWESRSQVSGYHLKKETDSSSKDNWSRFSVNRSNKENESVRAGRSSTCGYESSMENTSWKDRRSREMGSAQRCNKSKEFEDCRKSYASPRNSKFEMNFSPKKPDLSTIFRVDILENDKFEVKLAESGPPAVMILKESGSLNSMIDMLQEFPLKPMENISKGQKCAVKKTPDDYGTWYRGLIVEDHPLRVKFIDFSYEPVQVRIDDVRIIPEQFTSLNPFCYPVDFKNASIEEVEKLKTFEVVFLSKEYGTWNVNLVRTPSEEELPGSGNIRGAKENFESRMKQKDSHRIRPDLKVVLKKGVPVKVWVTYVDERSGKTYVTIQDKLEKCVNLIRDLSPTLPQLEEFRMNTMCLALYENDWYRARIISVNPLEVYFVDFGNTELTEKKDLKILPDEYMKIDPLVVPVKFRNGSKSSVNAEETLEIIPIEEMNSGTWVVRTSDEEEENENPRPNESGAPEVALGKIIEVQVTHKVSTTEYFVGPKNMEELLGMVEIEDEEVKEFGPLKTPSRGMLCLKMFDNVWCRAKITELEPLTIYYLDFGNVEKVQIEDLYPLPKRLQTIPPVAFKIHLLEPNNLPTYVPLKIKKVTERCWTAINDS